MRLLDRYLLRELLLPFGYCLGGFLMFWIVFDWSSDFGKFQEARLRAADIAEYYAVLAPEFLVQILPVGLLLALLYALTNHARYNEITAIRAAGVSLWRLSAPYFATGLVCSGVVFALNEYWVPDIESRAEAIKTRHVRNPKTQLGRDWVQNLGFRNTRDGRRWQIASFNVKTAAMLGPKVDWVEAQGSRRWIFAERAMPTNGGWAFFVASEFVETNSTYVPGLQTNLLFKPFSETPDEIRSEIKISQRLSVLRPQGLDVPIREIRHYLGLHPNASVSEKNWLYTKLHGRLAEPWKCLVVVVIAIPFGSASGRRNVYVGVASSIFICFAYYIFFQVGQAFGTLGTLPPWLAGWMPNILFGFGGIWLTARAR
ncbi:MAG: YjgP/YjgQ family permease [Verrucomicrobia bacterium]|nr:YjgP/YjgQ family permease [Verrucomicrobiota bacterium]